MKWMICLLFLGILRICVVAQRKRQWPTDETSKIRNCFKAHKNDIHFLVPEKFYSVTRADEHWNQRNCLVLLQKNKSICRKEWPKMEENGDVYLLHISKWHITKKLCLCVLRGRQCNTTVTDFTDSACSSDSASNSCQVTCLQTETICENSTYDENYCSNRGQQVQDTYIINITAQDKVCINCDNPVKKPEVEISLEDLKDLNVTIDFEEGQEVNPAQAAGVMSKMSDLAASINGSSAALSLGEDVSGILVRETEPEDVDEVSFAYASTSDDINIIGNSDSLATFSRSVTVPKEAFKKSIMMNVSVPFVSVFRFLNMGKDEMNSTVLGNEVVAVEMGTVITNLTDKISINFQNMKYEGIPSCHSWDGEGSRPNWTGSGCLTIQSGDNITCQCSHLTFFAILLTPLNETTSSSDLNTLTIITQVGCGLSMFFLSIILFMHCLMRRTKASKTMKILIQLVSAMFLLNFTFLINNYVAKLKSSVGCQIMAAVMHYFMLVTFTWFAVQAFHICLQLSMGGKIAIRHYVLKVSITSWVLPSVIGIVLLAIGKYGEQVIYTNDSEETVSMCWILDNDIHYIVNIGYYALVFLFTFIIFIIILSWLYVLKRNKVGNAQMKGSCKNIITILGLCCTLGITWGFAFFAFGAMRLPAYYIFTILNSFQGLFLFIYYYNKKQSAEGKGGEGAHGESNSSSSNVTLKSTLDSLSNPYGKN